MEQLIAHDSQLLSLAHATLIEVHMRFGAADPKCLGRTKQPITIGNEQPTGSFRCTFQPLPIHANIPSLVKISQPFKDAASCGTIFTSIQMEQLKYCVTIEKESENSMENYEFIGKVYLEPCDFQPLRHTVEKSIFVEDNIVGQFLFQYQIVLPFVHHLNVTTSQALSFRKNPFTNIKTRRQGPVICGHRGCGANRWHGNALSENTVLSLSTASEFGADYVEFDVHLSYDDVPVVHHDYDIEVTEDIKVPLNHLTVEQFLSLRPPGSHKTFIPNTTDTYLHTYGQQQSPKKKLTKSKSMLNVKHHAEKPTEGKQRRHIVHDTFNTLEELFNGVPEHVGFMVEIKFPSEIAQAQKSIRVKERNLFVDKVLKVVFDRCASRKIIFMSFDADICLLLRRKQSSFPVFFLIDIGVVDPDFDHFDHRLLGIDNIINFVKQANIEGITSSADAIVNNRDYVKKIREHNLCLSAYAISDKNVSQLKELEIDVLIVDNLVRMGLSREDAGGSFS